MKKFHIFNVKKQIVIVIVSVYLLLLQINNGESAVTLEQMNKSMAMIRSVCQPKTKISDELADGIKTGALPDDKTLKCYVHCIFEMTGMMKKNKINYDGAMRQIDMLMPDELKGPYKSSLNVCKDSGNGIKDNCDAAFAIIKCVVKENPEMIFP